MPFYKYKFIKDGEKHEKTGEFADKAALYAAVRNDGGSIISVEETKPKTSALKLFSFRKKIKTQEIITLARNLSVMLDAGLSVSRALTVLAKQSKSRNLVEVLNKINNSVVSGVTLSKSLEAYPNIFSNLFVSMVRAGEESGQLSNSLRIVADQLEKTHTLSKKIKGAMIYPSVIVCVMIAIGVLAMIFMVPTLTETFKGLEVELPLPTRVIIAISDFLRMNFILTIGVVLVLVFGIITMIRTQKGKNVLDFIILRLPLINTISREVNAARTSRTLSSLISSGVDIVSAINITSAVLQNHYFKNLLTESAKQVQMGELLSSSISNSKGNLFPVFVGEMLAVGEETGKVTDMLENIADYYESEVDQKTKDMSTVIEPFLMILIGIAVGIFAVAMLLPTYSLVDAI
ncbi:MAG: type II secretion system F family protein [Parcubacteria group bacterium]|nr:type II secretion system F family protein [Parcubacteria group bacterium]